MVVEEGCILIITTPEGGLKTLIIYHNSRIEGCFWDAPICPKAGRIDRIIAVYSSKTTPLKNTFCCVLNPDQVVFARD